MKPRDHGGGHCGHQADRYKAILTNRLSRRDYESSRLMVLVVCGFSALYAFFFSPVVFNGREFLSDGQLAAFHSDVTLWSDSWAGGWPAAADLTQMMFSPLRHLFRHISHGFNLFVVSSYVLISTFMFGYVYDVTRSRLAGTVAGLVSGFNGFMMAHLGHTGIISGAAWTPLLLWALERLRHGYKPFWLALGALSVCTTILSGHPQISAYSCLVAAAYAFVLGFVADQGKGRYWLVACGVFALGAGLCAVQWLPTHELSKETFRDAFSYIDYTSFSLPVAQLPMLVFPFLFGSQYGLFPPVYFGAASYTELNGYAGAASLVLAIAAIAMRRDRLTLFWALLAFVAVLLALGGSLPLLARLTYQMPVLNAFRVPGRHVYEYCLALAVLAGLGVATLQENNAEWFSRRVASWAALAVCGIVTLFAIIVHATLAPRAPWLPPAIYIPLLWLAIGVVGLFLYAGGRLSRSLGWLATFLVAVDIVSFGWFHEWRVSGRAEAQPAQRDIVRIYSERANEARQRVVGTSSLALLPDRARLHGIHSLNWYGPLLLRRYSEATGVTRGGAVESTSLASNHVGLDIFAGRYLFVEPSMVRYVNGIPFSASPLGLILGNGCGAPLKSRHALSLTAPVVADQMTIVSQLGCSTHVADGIPVAEVLLRDVDGTEQAVVLRAGMETAEWAVDCQDVRGIMHHQRATVFESTPVVRAGRSSCESHTYVAEVPIRRSQLEGIEIKIREAITLNVGHITLADRKTHSAHVVSQTEGLLAADRWRFVEAASDISVYENVRARPAAWLVSEAVSVSPRQALLAIRTSALGDGRRFDPARMALVQRETSLDSPGIVGKVSVVRSEDTSWEIRTASDRTALLVIGQNYYPGWRATVDGDLAEILRVNYTQQGVLLRAGYHKVRLDFMPASFVYGVAIAGISLLVILWLAWREDQRRAASVARPQ
jgi:Bacterial membrane protein YfhO